MRFSGKNVNLFILLVLIFALSLAIVSCGSDDSTTGDEDGDTSDGDAVDGDLDNGDIPDGDSDGDQTDGDIDVILDGDTSDGDLPDGDVTDGDVTDGDVTDGDVTDGDVTDGDVTDGDVTDGDVVDGDTDGDYDGPVVFVEAYRLSTLAIDSPEMVALGVDARQMLNNQIAQRIASGEINIIFKPDTDNVLDYPYPFQISMGELVGDEEYRIDPSSAYSVEVEQHGDDPRRFTTTEGAEFQIPLGSGPGETLVLHEAIVRGTYSDTFEEISDGVVAGAISEADAQSMVITNGITLAQVFQFLTILPDYTFEDGSKGYTFILSYHGMEVYLQPAQ